MAKPEIFRSGRNYGTTFGRIPKNRDDSVICSGRRSSSTASRSPFPPGEGIFLSSSLQTPVCRANEQNDSRFFCLFMLQASFLGFGFSRVTGNFEGHGRNCVSGLRHSSKMKENTCKFTLMWYNFPKRIPGRKIMALPGPRERTEDGLCFVTAARRSWLWQRSCSG